MALHWLPEDGAKAKPPREPRALTAIRSELAERRQERLEVWDGDSIGVVARESWLSERIEQLLDEMLEHPDYVKVPC